MSKQIAIHNSSVIKDYNIKLSQQQTQQPRAPPGPPQQHPTAPPAPGPPTTRSMSTRAASVTPPSLGHLAPAPARAASTPSTVTATTFMQPPPSQPPLPPETPEVIKMCNCNKKDLEREGCPLNGVCMTPNVIYGATVKIKDNSGEPIDMTKETYTGLSEPPWKIRKYGHNSDFKHKQKGTSKKGTTLSKYIWTLKDPDDCNQEPCPNKMEYEIKWRILARAKGYNPITGTCRLCLKEVYFLLFKTETASLNKKSEIFSPCPHRKSKFLANAKIT